MSQWHYTQQFNTCQIHYSHLDRPTATRHNCQFWNACMLPFISFFWKTARIQHQSDTDWERRVSAKGHRRVEVQLSGCLWLIKGSSGQTAADKGGHIPLWTTVALLQPLAVWSNLLSFFLFVSFFSLSYFCSTSFSLAFALLPFPSLSLSIRLAFLCPFSLLTTSVQ